MQGAFGGSFDFISWWIATMFLAYSLSGGVALLITTYQCAPSIHVHRLVLQRLTPHPAIYTVARPPFWPT